MGIAWMLLSLYLGGVAMVDAFVTDVDGPYNDNPLRSGLDEYSGNLPVAKSVNPCGSYYCYRVNNQIAGVMFAFDNPDAGLCNNNVIAICSPSSCTANHYAQSVASSRPLCPTYMCRMDSAQACSVSQCRVLAA